MARETQGEEFISKACRDPGFSSPPVVFLTCLGVSVKVVGYSVCELGGDHVLVPVTPTSWVGSLQGAGSTGS